jgi:choline kinase
MATDTHPLITQQAVILAAGMGTRLNGHLVPKPLHPVMGVPLLERTIGTLARAGVSEIIIVIGFEGEQVRRAVDTYPDLGVQIQFAENPDWKLSNGISVLKARPWIRGPFLLTMADHVLTDGMVHAMARNTPVPGGAILAVDANLAGVFDMDDATKVLADADGNLDRIGKEIPEYNRIDTGLFTCTDGLFDALQSHLDTHGDTSLSNGIQDLATTNRMHLHTIAPDQWWQDVDTPEAAEEAERRIHDQEVRDTAAASSLTTP